MHGEDEKCILLKNLMGRHHVQEYIQKDDIKMNFREIGCKCVLDSTGSE
jgi:hypothetical protein